MNTKRLSWSFGVAVSERAARMRPRPGTHYTGRSGHGALALIVSGRLASGNRGGYKGGKARPLRARLS
jgi:hypothetical protein